MHPEILVVSPRGRTRVVATFRVHLADQEGCIGRTPAYTGGGAPYIGAASTWSWSSEGAQVLGFNGACALVSRGADLGTSRRACRPEVGLLDYGLPGGYPLE